MSESLPFPRGPGLGTAESPGLVTPHARALGRLTWRPGPTWAEDKSLLSSSAKGTLRLSHTAFHLSVPRLPMDSSRPVLFLGCYFSCNSARVEAPHGFTHSPPRRECPRPGPVAARRAPVPPCRLRRPAQEAVCNPVPRSPGSPRAQGEGCSFRAGPTARVRAVSSGRVLTASSKLRGRVPAAEPSLGVSCKRPSLRAWAGAAWLRMGLCVHAPGCAGRGRSFGGVGGWCAREPLAPRPPLPATLECHSRGWKPHVGFQVSSPAVALWGRAPLHPRVEVWVLQCVPARTWDARAPASPQYPPGCWKRGSTPALVGSSRVREAKF